MPKWVNAEHLPNTTLDKNVSCQTVKCLLCYDWEISCDRAENKLKLFSLSSKFFLSFDITLVNSSDILLGNVLILKVPSVPHCSVNLFKRLGGFKFQYGSSIVSCAEILSSMCMVCFFEQPGSLSWDQFSLVFQWNESWETHSY